MATSIANQPPQPGLPVFYDEMVADFGVVTVVEDFRPGVDRLLLDFDPGIALPRVTFDMALEGGSTAVMGDGRLMVILRGVTGVATSDVHLRELPEPELWDIDPKTRLIENFDPAEDVVEVLYDPDQHATLSVEVRDFADGTGATILFNDEPILAVRGAQGMMPEDVILIPRRGHDA